MLLIFIIKIVYQSCEWAKFHLSPQQEDCGLCLLHINYFLFKINEKKQIQIQHCFFPRYTITIAYAEDETSI